MRRLLDDPDEAAELSAGARTLARERFGIDRFVRDWLAVLHEAAGMPGVSALLALLKAAPSVEVLVLGDAVLDGWLSGPTTRLSREAPVPVVDVRSEEYAAGGAANTAVNLAALGARVRFLSVVGDDEDGVLLRRVLREAGVSRRGRPRRAGPAHLREAPDQRRRPDDHPLRHR